MGVSISVGEDHEEVKYICDRCHKDSLDENGIVRLTAKKPDGFTDIWDLCPNCYSEVMDGAISLSTES